uniref:Uncharacterized protein n=1 Tax=Arundo donax TaxID=35708 RepID=A0A0A9E6N5_ARUDO
MAIPPRHAHLRVRAKPRGRQRQCRRVPAVLAAVRQVVVLLVVVGVVLFSLDPLGDGVVRG